MRTGIATFGLDYGKCPRWLFERMTKLARLISIAIVEEFGEEELLKRLADPVWFQSFGTILAFDWNASGLTTTTLGALKVGLRDIEEDLGIFVCGGKGKTSRKTPNDILQKSEKIGFSFAQAKNLVRASRLTAKVDSSLIQDGFQIYHHSFLFTKQGSWAVIQQGMNTELMKARRYHWLGERVLDFTEEPHQGIMSQLRLPHILNLTSQQSQENKKVSLKLLEHHNSLLHDLEVLQDYNNPQASFKSLYLENREFYSHPVEKINFTSKVLLKNFNNLSIVQPDDFTKLLLVEGVGPRTIRALSLVAEMIYGAKPSYEDPARYSFAFGGKDNVPYPVDRETYDKSLDIISKAISKTNILSFKEKAAALGRVRDLTFTV